MKEQRAVKQGTVQFARPEQVLYQCASATITSYLSEPDTCGNEIGVAHDTVIAHPDYLDAVNCSPANLFLIAISGFSFKKSLTQKHIYFNVEQSLSEKLKLSNLQANKLTRLEQIEWYRHHAYCIQIADKSDEQTKYAMMLTHLNNYFHDTFGINSWFEIKRIKCFALVRVEKESKPFSGQIEAPQLGKVEYIEVSGKMADLVYSLNSHKNNFLDYPIVDETGFSGHLTVKIKPDLTTSAAINRILEKYNLNLVQVQRRIGMVVIESTA